MQQFFLGVDASKGYADFVILDSKKRIVMPNFQLDDTVFGHQSLYFQLDIFFKNRPDCVICSGVESTGGYENNWFNSLLGFRTSLNLKAARLNPCGVSNHSKASLTRVTTDKISARGVAEYLIAHPEKVSYEHEDLTAGMRRRWNLIKMLTKQQTQLLNHLQFLMYTAQPQLLVYCKDGIPNWVFELLKLYPTAARLAKANAKSVAKIPYVTKDRAKELIADAKKSVASGTDPDTEQVLKMTVQQLLHLNRTIEAQKDQLVKHCPMPQVGLLKTFKGISDFSAVGLMLEIQTIARFPSVKRLASFFGLHPVFKTSGDCVGQMRMSKKGRKEPRRILFMVAMSAIGCNPLIRSIYEMHLEKGMAKMAAIGACMHKILRIVYGMLIHNRPFDPRVDENNRQKTKEAASDTSKTRTDKNRRYQQPDPKAPVSRRQSLKRRGNGNPSQSDSVTICGIMAPVPTEAS